MYVYTNFLTLIYKYFTEDKEICFSNSAAAEKFENINIEPMPKQEAHSILEYKFENPQFIIYENYANITKSNSLILNNKDIVITFASFQKTEHLDASCVDLMIQLKTFKTNASKRPSKYLILAPTNIFLNGTVKINPDYQSETRMYKLTLTEININTTQYVVNALLEMIKGINKSLGFGKSEAEEVEQNNEQRERERDEGRLVKLESLFEPVSFEPSEFWFTKNNENLDNDAEIAPNYVLSPKNIRNQNIKTELNIKTSSINFQLEDDQIPLIRLIISIKNSNLKNWLNEPTLSMAVSLEMAYFNQVKVVWEPIVEQIEDSNDMLKPYELLVNMTTNSVLREVENEENGSTNLPIRSFNISSTNNFQFVFTHTFFNLIDTIMNNYTILNGDKKTLSEENYDALKLEENNLIEMMKKEEKTGEMSDASRAKSPESDSDEDEDVDNPSFKILIKNELGFDLDLESITGFKVRSRFLRLIFNFGV